MVREEGFHTRDPNVIPVSAVFDFPGGNVRRRGKRPAYR
jgi:hypothetical protein